MEYTMRQTMVWPMLHHGTRRWNLVTLVTYHGMHPPQGICPMVYAMENEFHGHRGIFPMVQLTIYLRKDMTWQLMALYTACPMGGPWHIFRKKHARYEAAHGRPMGCPTAKPGCMPCMRRGTSPCKVQWNSLAFGVFHGGAHGICHVHTVHTMVHVWHDLRWCVQ